MILDERTEFADAVSLNTGAAGTYNIGDVIDTLVGSLNTTINQGNGQNLYLVISVDTSIITGGAAGTVQFRLVSDAVATPDTSTATVHYTSKAFVTDDDALNELDAGATAVVVALPHGSYERYLGIQQITGTTAITAGKINAFLTPDPSAWRAYADNVN
jgi:hypothetical protein